MDIIKRGETGVVTARRKKRVKEERKSIFEIYRSPKTIKDYMFYLKDFLNFVYEGEGDIRGDELIDLMKDIDKTDVEDYVENGKWKTRKGASGLETRNVAIADTPCNLSDRARNIIINRKLSRDVLEFFKPFGELSILDKEDATYITITEKACVDSEEIEHRKRKVCDLVITWGTPVVKVLPTKGTDIQLLVNRLKCQLRKYQFCIRCSACDSVCPNGAINTMGSGRYIIDSEKCPQNLASCSRCIAKFYNGCITCQVLAGKKKDENLDE